ncbi:MAG: DNA translocase FtsK [Chloroflexi bacterium]|nr:DNA translocase FtsK [Chloroflexota bacterium]
MKAVEAVGAPFAAALGAGVLIVAPVLAAAGIAFYLQRLHVTRDGAVTAAGWTMAALTWWGVLSWFKPDWHMAGEPLRDITLGGEVGRYLGRTPIGLLIWAGSFVGASLLAWPRLTRRVAALAPPTARVIWSLHVPERIWHTTIDGFRAMFSPGDGIGRAPTGVAQEPARVEPEDEIEIEPVTPRAAPSKKGPRATATAPVEEPAIPPPAVGGWPRPPRDLLIAAPSPEVAANDNALRAQLIVDTLGSFGVDAKVVSVSQGPTVTQFGVEPGWAVKTRSVVERDAAGRTMLDRDGRPKTRTEEVSRTKVRVNEITRLANDLALALAAPSIRIEAPVPGRPVIGIEVPNTNSAVVSLRQVIETPVFQRLGAKSKLALALGQGVSGEVMVADLAKMPHLLIAGSTGSGKSVCINSIITCILMHASPDEVRFVMVDPKRVELTGYEPIPHLALSKVIVDMEEVVGTLGAVIHEMDTRYRRFAELSVRNLEGYNKHPKIVNKLPQWVVIIDELADLMMAAPFEVEKQICRLAQLARATGIHLIIATQRPSVDVITGLIKANFPTRIAFAVTSQVDSRTILDSGGAEKLLGRGDMLYLATDASKPRRIQGVYVSDQEIERLVEFWANERFAPYRPPTYDHLLDQAKAEAVKEEEEDPLLDRARELAAEHSRISTSMLQRRLRIGYPRAARLMDMLEAEGIVGASDGGESRPTVDDGGEF